MASKSFKSTNLYVETWKVIKKESERQQKSIAKFVDDMIFGTEYEQKRKK